MGDRVEINGHGPEASAGRLCPEKGLDRRASRLATYDNCVVSGNEQLLDRPIEIRNDARQRLEARDYCGLVSASPSLPQDWKSGEVTLLMSASTSLSPGLVRAS